MTTINIKEFKPLVRVLDAVRAQLDARSFFTAVQVLIEPGLGRARWSLVVSGLGLVYQFNVSTPRTDGVSVSAWLNAKSVGALKGQKADFTLTLGDDGATVGTGGAGFAIKMHLPSAEAPEVQRIEPLEVKATFQAGVLLDAHALVNACTDEEHNEEVLVECGPDELRLAATSTTRLAYATVSGAEIAKETQLGWKVLLPARLLETGLKGFVTDRALTVTLSASADRVAFTSERVAVTLPLIERTFPNYRTIVPKKQSWVVEFDAKCVAGILADIRTALAMDPDRNKDNAYEVALVADELAVGYVPTVGADTVWVGVPGSSFVGDRAENAEASRVRVNLDFLVEGLPAHGPVKIGWTSSTYPITVTHTEGADYVFMPITKYRKS